MIKLVTINHKYRAITVEYKDGTWLSVRAWGVEYQKFVNNCTKFCTHIHTRNNGAVQVFEM